MVDTPSKTPPNSQRLNKNAEKVDTALDVSRTMLGVLRNAAQLTPVPYLSEAAGLALAIFDNIQGARANKDAFKRLATDTCGLVYAVLVIYKDQEKDGKPLSVGLINNSRNLLDTLHQVDKFARKQTSRNVIMRIFTNRNDNGKIQEYRERLRQALDVFGLQSTITVEETVARIAAQQEDMVAALRQDIEARSKTDKLPSGGASLISDHVQHIPTDSRTLQPHASSAVEPPLGSVSRNAGFVNSNYGGGSFTSINGDHIVSTVTNTNNSSNCGNVSNISTVNSNNNFSTEDVHPATFMGRGAQASVF